MVKKFKVNKYGQIEVGPSNKKDDDDKDDDNRLYVRSPFIIAAAILMIAVFATTLFLH